MSSNDANTSGMKVSTFLRDEKKSCKQMQKKILKDMPVAIPQGKSFSIQAENIGAKTGDPSVVAKVLWKEKRSGADFQGQMDGPAAHSVLLALTGLKEKTQEMTRAQK
ncbi:hypothetical protein QM012_009032 [Aureobasidium pullulans]|uniref:Uncharacterized protein n=1 Tax=Aureobasidium pullulans TaxID=5580 RepID=A0ABR0TIK4_AURPU